MSKIIKYYDKKNNFKEVFNVDTGFYMRTGVLDRDKKDTNVDPFMRNYPGLLDVGILGHCIHGLSGKCIKSGVQCYQNGLGKVEPHMTLEQFKTIVNQTKGKTFQFALGGRGDVNKHPEFEEIVKYCRDNNIVPNYTTSGLDLTEDEIRITKENCGAVAVSEYRANYTRDAIRSFIKAGVKTNIHYVLGNNSIDEAINKLENNSFDKGINAVIFLLHKPVGLGTQANVLQPNDPRVAKFFNLVDTKKFDFKIGFDSCCTPGVLNFTNNVNIDSIDTCEAARHSGYIAPNMKMLPCSFDNEEERWAVDLNTNTIQEAWDSDKFEDFRNHFRISCKGCSKRTLCLGNCPIKREIVLCNNKEKDLK